MKTKRQQQREEQGTISFGLEPSGQLGQVILFLSFSPSVQLGSLCKKYTISFSSLV